MKIQIYLNSIKKVKKFIHIVEMFDCDIDVSQGRYVVSGKSIMGIFSLNILDPLNVEILSEDQDIIDSFIDKMTEFMEG